MDSGNLCVERPKITPFLKWVGGKRQLLPEIRKYLPPSYKSYFEPFLGAGALFFELRPKASVINDINTELMNCYQVIKENLSDLILDLSKHKHNQEYYYQLRSLDRQQRQFQLLNNVQRASRFIYLNRTCFNGLYRVNREGYFNASFGKYKNPNYQNFELLQAISDFLNQNNVMICNNDFQQALISAENEDFIYFDPPYDPLNQTSKFTHYQTKIFRREEQLRLKNTFDELNAKGCKLMLSNSATEFIRELYQDYRIIAVKASRAINSKGSGRGQVEEFLILNYW